MHKNIMWRERGARMAIGDGRARKGGRAIRGVGCGGAVAEVSEDWGKGTQNRIVCLRGPFKMCFGNVDKECVIRQNNQA